MCLSLLPLSTNSLVYGSDDEGLTFKNDNNNALQAALEVGKLFNLKPHTIKERLTQRSVQTLLPYDVQIHKAAL